MLHERWMLDTFVINNGVDSDLDCADQATDRPRSIHLVAYRQYA